MVGIQAEEGVLAAEADAEGPAGRGGALGVGHLHEVDVAVGGDEVHAAQRVEAAPRLPERRPHLVPQLLGKLQRRKLSSETECRMMTQLEKLHATSLRMKEEQQKIIAAVDRCWFKTLCQDLRLQNTSCVCCAAFESVILGWCQRGNKGKPLCVVAQQLRSNNWGRQCIVCFLKTFLKLSH